MNNIHEDDWSEDSWSRHSGMFLNTTPNPDDDEEETLPLPQKTSEEIAQ